MRARTMLAWIAVGLVGLALAAGVTYAATQLSSQRIGLSAEPPSAGEELAPPTAKTTTRTTSTTPPRTTKTTPSGGNTPPVEPDDSREPHNERSEDHSGHGSGDGDLDD